MPFPSKSNAVIPVQPDISFVAKDQICCVVVPAVVLKFKLYAVTIPADPLTELIITASG